MDQYLKYKKGDQDSVGHTGKPKPDPSIGSLHSVKSSGNIGSKSISKPSSHK